MNRAALVTASLATLLGAGAVAGWAADVPALRALRADWPPLSPELAVILTLTGAALLLHRHPRTRPAARGIAWLVILAGLAQLLSAALRAPSPFDAAVRHLLGLAPAGPASPRSALGLVAVGLGLEGLSWDRRPWFNPSAWLGTVVAVLAGLGLISLAFGLRATPIAFIAMLLVGVGLATARMEPGLLRVMSGETSAALLGRRLFAMVALLPVAAYALQHTFGPVDGQFHRQLFLLTFVYAIGLLVVVALSLREVDQVDRARAAAEAERGRLLAGVQHQAATLQQQVAERTAELESALSRSLRFDHLARSTTNGLMITDADDRIEWVNPAWESCTGWTLAEVRGRRPGEFLRPPGTGPDVADRLARARAAGEPAAGEMAAVRKDGATSWFSIEVQPLRPAAGGVASCFSIISDITFRKQQEEQQRQLNQRLELALRAGLFGVWDWDVRAGVQVWDRTQLDIFGLANAGTGGRIRDWTERIHADDRPFVQDLERRMLASGTSYSYECRIRRPDGGIREIEAHGIVHRDETGRAVRVVGLNRDITHEKQRERDLGSLSQRLQFVVTAAGYGAWEYDFARKHLTWDDALLEIHGLRRDQVTGDLADWRRRVHPDDLPALDQHFRDVLDGHASQFDPEYRIIRPGGAVRYIESRSYLLRNPDGTPQLMVGLNRDVTAARELRERLRITEERWRLALASNNDGVWDWDIPRGRVYRDERYAEILGVPVAELPGNEEEWQALVHPDDLAAMLKALREHLAGAAPFYQCEYRVRHKLGHWIWVLDRGKVVARDARGQPQRMVGTQTDITTRKSLEERLRHNEELALQLSRLAQIGPWEVELPTRRVIWGPEVYRIHEVDLGYTPELASALAFYPPDARRVLEEALRQCEHAGTPFDLELPFTTARGHRLWVRTLGRAEMKQGRAVRLYGAFQDITARRDAEEMRRQLEGQLFQAQKMETLGTLAGGIAHDFNNLLTGILGYQDLALDTLDEGHTSRGYLASARDASLRARELVDQILTFSRQAGSEKVPVNLALVVEDARRFLRATVPATIAIETHLAPGCGPVLADATQIHQVLLNLGSNAAYAMRATGGTMRLSLAPVLVADDGTGGPNELPPGRYVRLEFSDTGHGIDEETQKRIFDPFFTTKEVGQGTGLGLSVVHGIIQAHRGAISVRSTPGQGATFTLHLPAADDEAMADGRIDAAAPRGQGEVVAIVDDEDIVRSFAQMALESAGYRVASFDHPGQCLEAIRREPGRFALLLTDQTMPGMKGIELAAEVRAFAATLPVIIMSGYFSRISPETLARLGRIELLSKPFTNDELARAVNRGLYPEQEKAGV